MNKHIGSTLESLFESLGSLEEVTRRALKKGVAESTAARMLAMGMSKAELATQLKTSRSQLSRVLDPDDTSITLATLVRLATILGLNAEFSLCARESESVAPVLLRERAPINLFKHRASGYRGDVADHFAVTSDVSAA